MDDSGPRMLTLAELKVQIDGLLPENFENLWESYMASFSIHFPVRSGDAARLRVLAALVERREREGFS